MTDVVAALIWEGDRFLACQRPAHKARGLLWEFVGGKVEPGESLEDALGPTSSRPGPMLLMVAATEVKVVMRSLPSKLMAKTDRAKITT